MRNQKQWTARVFVAPAPEPGQPTPQAVEVAERAFRMPSGIHVDAVKREARARLKLDGYKLRSISVGAPIESRVVLVYLEQERPTP